MGDTCRHEAHMSCGHERGHGVRNVASTRLTDKAVSALEAPVTGNRLYYDRDVSGFACRVTSSGQKSFVLNYRIRGRERRITIGRWPAWKTKAARAEAATLRQEIDRGFDPLEEREEERKAPTVADLAKRYDAEHLPGKRPRSAGEDRALIRDYILPALGRLKVADIKRADVEQLHRTITKAGKPIRANRVLACLRTMFARAMGWQMRADNPARGGRDGVQMNAEDGRERFLSEAEIARLSEVLARHSERTTVALIGFLMMTGARFGEAANATWDQFDLEQGIWVRPSSHTKQKRKHAMPLSAPATALISELQAEATGPYVFPSPKTGRPLVTTKTAWARICRDAELEGVRIHDLRHSFASVLAGSGASLQLIGSLLGHTQVTTTMRYAHLADDARRAAVERVGAVFARGLPAEVINIKTGRAS
jgi:integrase